MPPLSWKVYAMAGAVVAAFLAAWFIQSVRWDNDVLSIHNQYKADQLLVASANQAMLNNAIIARDAAQEKAALLSRQLQENLKNEKSKNERLANSVADGTVRLLVSGTTTATNGSVVVPGAGRTGSVSNVVQFELSESARQSYFALRESIASDSAMIEYYKKYISQQCYRENK